MRKIFLIAFTIVCGHAFAQSGSLYLFDATCQQYVNMATGKSFVKVARSYVVRDKESGETYKRDGRDDFNEVQSFGIRVKGGLIVPSTIDRPWEKDTAFAKYRNWYDGVPRRFTVETPTGKVVMDSNINIVSCHSGNMLYMVSLDNDYDGLALDTTDGNVAGWIILWLANNDSTSSITSFRKEAALSSGKDIVEFDKPHTSSNIIGGIFVKPVSPSPGIIEFRLCGVVLDKGEKLLVTKPIVKNIPIKKDETKSEQVGQKQPKRPSLEGLSPVPTNHDETIGGGKAKATKKRKR